ncbi:DUF4142 domain-containing protein [Algoriphagus sp.]|uniref:DUF4142 domain-containing protein n=1 Tax=Algoriphagus sp. TaxID=1872435 RepID=UPI003F72C94F
MNIHSQTSRRFSGFYYLLIVLFLSAACDRGNTGNKDSQIDDDLDQERTFALEAAYSNLAEIKMGELARSKAESESVVQFAEMMVKEHQTALDKLRSISKEEGIDLPDTMKTEHKRIQDEISALQGSAFDNAYMQEQVKAHEKAQALFQSAINEDAHPSFMHYARTTLEHVNSHLDRAKGITGAMNNQPMEGNLNNQ